MLRCSLRTNSDLSSIASHEQSTGGTLSVLWELGERFRKCALLPRRPHVYRRGPRRGIKNDSIDIIEVSKGFQPIAIVLISKKIILCLSLSIDGQFTVIHYPSIPSYNYLIVKGFDREKKCRCWELNSSAFHAWVFSQV
jgi:hypothetical protein